jgi:uncharacterized protein (TIGR02646 family)
LVPTLAPGGRGWIRASKNLNAREVDRNAELTFPDHWNELDVRGVLYALQGNACAYCGRDLDRGDVDHFRPKSRLRENPSHGGYWWLAYELKNYFLSCRRCNSTYKSDRFPLRPRARRVTFQDRTRLLREARLLLDPARDPIEQWLRVDWLNERCLILPAPGLSSIAQIQVEGTLKFFRINSDPRLVRDRKEFRDLVAEDIEKNRTDEVRSRAIRYRPHSLVARQVLIDRGERLPSEQEELAWLLNHLLAYLDLALDILEDVGPNAPCERLMREVLWSFAALRHDPPGVMRDQVESFLAQKEILPTVREYARLLTSVGSI